MSSGYFSTAGVGNDFVISAPRIRPISTPKVIKVTVGVLDNPYSEIPVHINHSKKQINIRPKLNIKYLFILLSLTIVLSISIASYFIYPNIYKSLYLKIASIASTTPKPVVKPFTIPYSPLTLLVPTYLANTKIQDLSSQPTDFVVGTKTVAIPSTTIASWISEKTFKSKGKTELIVNPVSVENSLTQLADANVVTPEESITMDEAGVTENIFPGTSGTTLANPSSLSSGGNLIANGLLAGKGINLNLPVVSVPPPVGNIATMGKVLVANVTTKRLYAYDSGQLVNTFLVTAGKPSTPTPLGEFHIWDKLTKQDMTGYNPNGTTYNQPNVQWINYFDHSGDAIHGNYWRPASYFGNINSSHGCVGVQDAQAEWIFDWAPIGTTVITHA